MKLLFTLALMGWAAVSFAQDPADIFHKTVDVDDVNAISFDVYAKDQIEYRTWPGDDLLIETTVQIKNVQQDILDFYMKQDRYILDPRVSGDQMALVSHDKSRRMVKGTEGSAFEEVMIVVYMPEDFAASGEGTYIRTSR